MCDHQRLEMAQSHLQAALLCLDEVECRDEGLEVLCLMLEAIDRAVCFVSPGPVPDPISEIKVTDGPSGPQTP